MRKVILTTLLLLSLMGALGNRQAFAQTRWSHTYGGADWDEAGPIQQTSDGGYIVAGTTESFGAGSGDFWVLKLNAGGNVTWQRTYGGADRDSSHSMQQTSRWGIYRCRYDRVLWRRLE